ncbi:DODA-type extradiol aromatic ring-opening family dioxygenase [Marinobacter nauticus]|uniref:DODA-type extradiol aromatic ring-opening family dioxygenase n=1 Tax=Marinobacter nauticus TaxID=2743 RepID=UPI001C98DA0A|nr:class III extradiol ring-cleavage dioxygenase [Marinobacter nauticus]MBY6220711.1 dioxygenase [Marinobacter nauticus]MCC4272307.1 dioxygenase [Marinobacter nauticus]
MHHKATQPVLFIPHGAGPCFFMDWNPPTTWNGMAKYLANVSTSLPEPPSAILMVSAHWLAPEFTVTSGQRPNLTYDYYGFPEHTYQLSYPAEGMPSLASEVVSRLKAAGIEAHEDAHRGFDHGMFIPLKLMFPEADIPVVQLSLKADMDPVSHLEAGEALTGLREEGVLIIGSGMSFHNMRGYGDARYTQPSETFNEWLVNAVHDTPAERKRALGNWTTAPHARDCHPPRAEEHLIPLMVAAGAAGADQGRTIYTENVLKTRLSGFRFG